MDTSEMKKYLDALLPEIEFPSRDEPATYVIHNRFNASTPNSPFSMQSVPSNNKAPIMAMITALFSFYPRNESEQGRIRKLAEFMIAYGIYDSGDDNTLDEPMFASLKHKKKLSDKGISLRYLYAPARRYLEYGRLARII